MEYSGSERRSVAVIAAGGWAMESAKRIKAVCDSNATIFGRSDAVDAFSSRCDAIIFLGHGCSGSGGGWKLGGRTDPVFDWDDVPVHLNTHVLLFASCHAAGLAINARRRMPDPNLVIHAARDWNTAYIADASATALAVAQEALNLPEELTQDNLTRMWRAARDAAKDEVREIGHHEWDFTTTPATWWRRCS